MNKRIYILIIAVLLTSCSVRPTEAILPSVTPSPHSEGASYATSPAIPSSLMPVTPSPTVTATEAPTPIPAVISTPTSSPEPVNYQCLEITDGLPSNHVLDGTWVFNSDGNLRAFLLNLTSNQAAQFPREEGDRLHGFRTSPDRTRILYYHAAEQGKWVIVIAGVDGQQIWSQDVSEDIGGWSWFDNERLMYEAIPQIDELPYIALLNSYTGEYRELQTDYPGFAKRKLRDVRWTGGAVKYDPTLTRVVYPECDPECEEWLIRGEPGYPVVLWDLETGQILARLMTMDVFGQTPIWSPDGTQFIMATNLDSVNRYAPANEFYAVSRDGQVRQLTHFMDYYTEAEIYNNYSLSPDGHFVAFWMTAQPSPYDDDRLVVVNTLTGEVTNYCIPGDPFPNDATGPESNPTPIWSPNGNQLLVVLRDPQDTNRRWVVLVDMALGYAAKVAEEVEPVGWMVSP